MSVKRIADQETFRPPTKSSKPGLLVPAELIADGSPENFLLVLQATAQQEQKEAGVVFLVLDVSGSMEKALPLLLMAMFMVMNGQRLLIALFGDENIDSCFPDLLEVDLQGIVDQAQFAQHVHSVILQAMCSHPTYRYAEIARKFRSICHTGTKPFSLDHCLFSVLQYAQKHQCLGSLLILTDAEFNDGVQAPKSIQQLNPTNFLSSSYLLFVGHEKNADAFMEWTGVDQKVCLKPERNNTGQWVLSPEDEEAIGRMFNYGTSSLQVSGENLEVKPSGSQDATYQTSVAMTVSSGSTVLVNCRVVTPGKPFSVQVLNGQEWETLTKVTETSADPARTDRLFGRALNTLKVNILPEKVKSLGQLNTAKIRELFLYLRAAAQKKVRPLLMGKSQSSSQRLLWEQFVVYLTQVEQLQIQAWERQAERNHRQQTEWAKAIAKLSSAELQHRLQETETELATLSASLPALQSNVNVWQAYEESIRHLGLGLFAIIPEEHAFLKDKAVNFQLQQQVQDPPVVMNIVMNRGGVYRQRRSTVSRSKFQEFMTQDPWYQQAFATWTEATQKIQSTEARILTLRYQLSELQATGERLMAKDDVDVLVLVQALVGISLDDDDCPICYCEKKELVQCCPVCKNCRVCRACAKLQTPGTTCFFCRTLLF